MYKMMIPLAIVIGLCVFSAPQVSAQQGGFYTEFDQTTVDNINSVVGGNLIETETRYLAIYSPTNKPNKVKFSVYISPGITIGGEGSLDQARTTINVNKAVIAMGSAVLRLRGQASNFRLPIYPMW